MICEYCQTEHPPDQIANPHYCIARLNEKVEVVDRLKAENKALLDAVYDFLNNNCQ